MGREWRFPFWAHALKFWHCMDFSRYRFLSTLGNKTGHLFLPKEGGHLFLSFNSCNSQRLLFSFYQCWIWPWSKMCLHNTSWSQIAESFCLFYFALYLESIFEVTTCTQQEPWNFRVISLEWNPHTFGLRVYSYTCSSLCFFYPSCWKSGKGHLQGDLMGRRAPSLPQTRKMI